MSNTQIAITIAVVAAATILTRFLPYILFPEGKTVPPFVRYLGRVLAPAVFGLLVVYCLRNVHVMSGAHGIPELISLAVTVALYLWRRGMILPMLGGTVCYMLLVQLVF